MVPGKIVLLHVNRDGQLYFTKKKEILLSYRNIKAIKEKCEDANTNVGLKTNAPYNQTNDAIVLRILLRECSRLVYKS